MSYLVTARKWRPNLFEEMVGQDHVVRTLQNAVSSGRIAHAYLFSGPRGVGKTTAARILARALNCAEGPTPKPCNSCEACRNIINGTSVDVSEIDGASNTGVENIRDLRENVRYMPSEGRYRVYIIDEVHMLSTPAFNALLKTLEEPPAHVVFIFATTEVHKIPRTILSRCQRFDFRRIAFRQIHAHLKKIALEEGITIDDSALFSIAREAEGSLRDAQSMLDQVVSFAGREVSYDHVVEALGLMDRDMLFELGESIVEGDGRRCLNIVEKIYEFGYDFKKVLTELIEHVRNLVIVKVAGRDAALDLPAEELERIRTMVRAVSTERLQMLFSTIARGYEDVARAAEPRFSLEMVLLRAAHTPEIRPIEELIAGLEELKKKLGKGTVDSGAAGLGGAPSRDDRRPLRRGEKDLQAGKRAPEDEAAPERAGTDDALFRGSRGGSGGLDGLIDYIVQTDRLFARHLDSAGVSLNGNELCFEVPQSDYGFLDIKRARLEKICAEYLKRSVRVSLRADRSAKAEKEEKDPLLREAMSILGARIIEERRRDNV